MGAVYEAEGPEGARFAVKILDPEWAKDEVAAARFAREAQRRERRGSEHIVGWWTAAPRAGAPTS